ncbi:hypothetical protein [Ralstonia phage RP31]|uniref:Uncharacterized protein n=2 Tax=Ripduovirus RP12 TaxID=2560700 RepID=A0A1L7N0V1_9CAUD|nr:hypothetical protein FDH28_gp122 [Ralstonia phage RP12]BAW19096.1 hypothetical protein [Ralstonia phage RP12]BAW19382.1 hypothetical protein [Ralstonia phage RP31]
MSVVIVDLTKHVVVRNAANTKASDPTSYRLKDYTEEMADALIVYDSNGDAKPVVRIVLDEISDRYTAGESAVPDQIALLSDDPKVKLGRIGVREITSPWVSEHYPEACREVVITLVEPNNAVHTLLAYV